MSFRHVLQASSAVYQTLQAGGKGEGAAGDQGDTAVTCLPHAGPLHAGPEGPTRSSLGKGLQLFRHVRRLRQATATLPQSQSQGMSPRVHACPWCIKWKTRIY